MTSKSLLAVLVGAGVGVLVAVGARDQPPAEPEAPPLAPAAARAIPKSSAAPEPVATAGEPLVERAATEAGVTEAVAPPAAVSTAEPTDDEVPIATKREFEAAAVACNEKDTRACRRAATAAELGTAVPKDPERAKTFRRIELTVLVRACEKSSVADCLTLADRYLRGDFVARNERTAAALIEHARELCAKRPEDACRNVPSN